MDKELNKKSLMLGVPGIILQLVGHFLSRSEETALVGLLVLLVGTVLLIAGLWWYAKAKGHSGWWGLMGLLSLLGLIVLALLPDRRK